MREKEQIELVTSETTIRFPDITVNAFISRDLFNIDRKMPWNTVVHNHAFFEFHYIVEGEADVICYQREEKKEPVHLTTGDVMIIAPLVYHYAQSKNVECFRIGFHFYFSDDRNSEYEHVFDSSDGYCVLKNTRKIQSILKQLYEEEYSNSKLDEAYKQAQMMLLFIEIFEYIDKDLANNKAVTYSVPSYLANRKYTVERYLRKAFEGNATLSGLSKELFLSEKQTTRFLKKEFGKSFSGLLAEYRILNAKVLLLNDKNLSIAEIAERVGFQSQVGFINAFKRLVGITPSHFRKQSLKEIKI